MALCLRRIFENALSVEPFTFLIFSLQLDRCVEDKRLEHMNRAIEDSRQNVDHTIDAINRNYVNFLKANITHHQYLKDMAEKSGDLNSVMHHMVMVETYRSMLERSLSR
jgi:hypothetical protein